jgi:anti-anti-sigma factor
MVSLLNLYGPLRLEADLTPPRLTLHLVGEFDFAGEKSLHVVDNLTLSDVDQIIVDLARLEFIDSTAARALRGFVDHHRLRGREVLLIHPPRNIRRTMQLLDMTEYLHGPPG